MIRRKKNGELAVSKTIWETKAFQYHKTHKDLSAILAISDVDLQRSELNDFVGLMEIYAEYCNGAAYSTRKGRPKIFVERDDTQIEKIMTPVESDISFYKMIEAERFKLAGPEIKPMSVTNTIRWFLAIVANDEDFNDTGLSSERFIERKYNAYANRYQRGKRAIKNQ